MEIVKMQKYLVVLEWDEGEERIDTIIVESNMTPHDLTKYLFKRDNSGHLLSLEVKPTVTDETPAFVVEKKPIKTPLDNLIEDIEEGKI